jgi:hypothetical protein
LGEATEVERLAGITKIKKFEGQKMTEVYFCRAGRLYRIWTHGAKPNQAIQKYIYLKLII